ncbi:hypothetical protein BDD12DRAFT_746447 [Trichophaea hybrida]|nr:hypothetical protein BDD12DRAFT_746447 [Trichophaea hybrida]
MPVSHTGTYWQSHLQALCNVNRLSTPVYEVFEHNGGNIPLHPSSNSAGVSTKNPQCWYSCVVNVNGRDYETSYVYRAEENARERAAKKAYEALSS